MTKFIDDLKANGYVEGDLSTLPADISEADRRKVEQHEADLANEKVKGLMGEKPPLQTFHTELNPNQYGYAEQRGQRVDTDAKATRTEKADERQTKRDPLDHDDDGRKGGHIDNRRKTDKK